MKKFILKTLQELQHVLLTSFTRYSWVGGRSNRLEFFYFMSFAVGLVVSGRIFDFYILDVSLMMGPAVFTALLFLVLPVSALIVRRLHDINRRGWWYGAYLAFSLAAFFWGVVFRYDGFWFLVWLCMALWVVASLALFNLLVQEGDADENRFGLPPREIPRFV